jgi:hypothetical protein
MGMMEDPQAIRAHERGSGLIFAHFAALDRLDEARVSARSRLEATLGDDLTRLLVGALTTSGERPSFFDELDGSAA